MKIFKNVSYDKMDLRLIYFHVTIYTIQLHFSQEPWVKPMVSPAEMNQSLSDTGLEWVHGILINNEQNFDLVFAFREIL